MTYGGARSGEKKRAGPPNQRHTYKKGRAPIRIILVYKTQKEKKKMEAKRLLVATKKKKNGRRENKEESFCGFLDRKAPLER